MMPDRRVGHLLGVLLLLHFFLGLILPYVLLDAALVPPSFLESAAADAAGVRGAVGLFILAAVLVLGIAIAAWPLLRADVERLAMALLALAIANVSLQLVESGALLTMLSLSQDFAIANGGDISRLQAAGAVASAARKWAHYTQLLTVVSWLFLLYVTLWRTALVPRLLAAAGMVTTALQIVGVPVRGLLGYPPIMEMAMPLAPVHVMLAAWLIVKGVRVAPDVPRPLARPVALGHG